MTEEEARKALFELHFNHMKLNPNERKAKEAEYQQKRAIIRHELAKTMIERKEKEIKIK